MEEEAIDTLLKWAMIKKMSLPFQIILVVW